MVNWSAVAKNSQGFALKLAWALSRLAGLCSRQTCRKGCEAPQLKTNHQITFGGELNELTSQNVYGKHRNVQPIEIYQTIVPCVGVVAPLVYSFGLASKGEYSLSLTPKGASTALQLSKTGPSDFFDNQSHQWISLNTNTVKHMSSDILGQCSWYRKPSSCACRARSVTAVRKTTEVSANS